MKTHAEFAALLVRASREKSLPTETIRLGEILLRYIAVLEQVADVTPAVREAAENARKEFEAALSLPKNGEGGT